MPQSLEELVTFDVIPLVRTALKETAELTGAVHHFLTQRVEELTGKVRQSMSTGEAAHRTRSGRGLVEEGAAMVEAVPTSGSRTLCDSGTPAGREEERPSRGRRAWQACRPGC